jgi:hypothetical protein
MLLHYHNVSNASGSHLTSRHVRRVVIADFKLLNYGVRGSSKAKTS